MTDHPLEELLRKSPRLKVPEDLLASIEASIRLPQHSRQTKPVSLWSPDGFKKWFPAFALGVLLLACFSTLAVQVSRFAKLREEREALRQQRHSKKTIGDEISVKQLQTPDQDLERLRKENAEVRALREEVARLSGEIQRLENQSLAAGPKTGPSDLVAPEVSAASEEANSTRCVSNLKYIGLSARIYAVDNGGLFPSDFLSIQNELSTPLYLHCPSDLTKPIVNGWSALKPEDISYSMVTPGLKESVDANVVFVQCPIHGHVCLYSGAVMKFGPGGQNGKIVLKGGRKVYVPEDNTIDGNK